MDRLALGTSDHIMPVDLRSMHLHIKISQAELDRGAHKERRSNIEVEEARDGREHGDGRSCQGKVCLSVMTGHVTSVNLKSFSAVARSLIGRVLPALCEG